MLRTIEAFEHDTLHVSPTRGPRQIKEDDFAALIRFNDAQDRRFFDVGYRRIKLRSFVGYLQVGDLAIEILPKADRGSAASPRVWRDRLLEMLRVALGLRIERAPAASQQVNIARADRFFVEYQTFDHDIAVNWLLAAALHTLGGCARSPHAASRVAACLARFPEVRHAGVTHELFDRVRLTRATQRYQPALMYARMILEHQGPQLQVGTRQVFALLFDMNVLWERYVAALFRRAAAAVDGLIVSTQEHRLFCSSAEEARRHVRPDVVVRAASADGPAQPVLVVDTKWKVPRRGQVSDDDLKQMFVYNELLAGARSVLLYPATANSAAARGTYAGKPHGCEQRFFGPPGEQAWTIASMCAEIRPLLEEARDAAPL